MDELLEEIGAPGDMSVAVPSWHYEEDQPRRSQQMPLQEALLKCYDLRQGHPI